MPSEQLVNCIIAIINYLSMKEIAVIPSALYYTNTMNRSSVSSLTRPSTDKYVAWFWHHPDFQTKFMLLHIVNAKYLRFITITGSIPLLVDDYTGVKLMIVTIVTTIPRWWREKPARSILLIISLCVVYLRTVCW